MVKDILKPNDMCTVLFVEFVCLMSNICDCLFDSWNFQSPNRSCNEDKYCPWIHSPCLMINTFTPDHVSNMIISQHFTFLWGPLPMLPSIWQRSGSYCAMYSVIVQCNACPFHSFFLLRIRSKYKPKIDLDIWLHPL